jgi:hypothetical protein
MIEASKEASWNFQVNRAGQPGRGSILDMTPSPFLAQPAAAAEGNLGLKTQPLPPPPPDGESHVARRYDFYSKTQSSSSTSPASSSTSGYVASSMAEQIARTSAVDELSRPSDVEPFDL